MLRIRCCKLPEDPASLPHTRLWSGIISKFFWFWQLPSKHGIVFRAARPTLNLFSLISFGHTRQSRYAQSSSSRNGSSSEQLCCYVTSWHGQIIHVGKPLVRIDGSVWHWQQFKGKHLWLVWLLPFFPMLTTLNTFGAGPKAWIELQFSLSGRAAYSGGRAEELEDQQKIAAAFQLLR